MKKVLVIALFLVAGLAIAAEKTTKTSSATTTETTKSTTDLVRSFGGFGGETSGSSVSTRGR